MLTLTFDGISSGQFDLIISDYRRPLFAEVRDEYMTIEGRSGQKLKPKKQGNITIDVEFKRINRSSEEWVQKAEDIAAWLYTEDERELRFDDEPGERYYIGKVSSAPSPETIRNVAVFSVTFTCHPFKYGERRTETFEVANGVEKHVENNGTAESPFLLTIKPRKEAGEITVTVNEADIHYKGTIQPSDIITIDTYELELRLNGALKVKEVSGHFAELRHGINTISCSVLSDVTIDWQEMYR